MRGTGLDPRFISNPTSDASRRLAGQLEALKPALGLHDSVVAGIRGQPWDRELLPGEVKKLPPRVKGIRTAALFYSKLNYLIAFIDDEKQRLAVEPRNYLQRPGLRKWTNPELRLWSWSDPEVDRPNGDRYPELCSVYQGCLLALQGVGKGRLQLLEVELRIAKQKIAALELQNLSLMDRLNKVHRNVARPAKQ